MVPFHQVAEACDRQPNAREAPRENVGTTKPTLAKIIDIALTQQGLKFVCFGHYDSLYFIMSIRPGSLVTIGARFFFCHFTFVPLGCSFSKYCLRISA